MRDLQKIKFIVFLLLTSIASFACDVCSCGASSNTSLSGGVNSNYIGLSYNFVHFTYKEGIVANSPTANDYVHTTSVLGQYFVTDKIQVNAIVPFRKNRREATTGNLKNQGIGDVTVYGLYNVLKEDSQHQLKVGTGLKLPTGSFNLQRATLNQTSATQLGTGSLDVLFPVQYKFQFKKITVNANGTYFIKNKNKQDFKFGNQTQLNANITYRLISKKTYVLEPSIGVNFDDFEPTERLGIIDKRTSGMMTNVNIGIKATVKKMVVGVNYQQPIQQNLIDGEVQFKQSVGVFTYYKF